MFGHIGMSASLHDTVLLTVGHTGKCTAYHLCLKTNLKMKHPYQMSSNAQYKPVYEWLKEHKPTIDEIACLCLPCVKQIQRNHDRKLIYSPDTDVYHIGLSIVGEMQECDVIIQLSKYTDDRARYLSMNNVVVALNNDPDLSEISSDTRPQVIQSIYVATGCDYTSFFNGLGKVTFLATFFQHAAFIAGSNSPPGTIGEMTFRFNCKLFFSTTNWVCLF